MNQIRTFVVVAVATLMLAACGGAADPTTTAAAQGGDTTTSVAGETTTTTEATPETVTVAHAQGETEVPFQPQRVVVFEYAALDTIDALGVDSVVGLVKGTLPPSLAHLDTDAVENVGTLFEPDYEAIAALEPDLVIVGGRSATTFEEMSKVAVTIDLSYGWEDFAETFDRNTRTIGTIFGLDAEVDSALSALETAIADVNAAAADAGNALIVMTSAGEVTAYGPGSRFGAIHDQLGVTPAVPDVEAATHGDAISFEFILETNPSILYVLDRDAAIGAEGEAAAQVLDNELVHETDAWKNDRIVYLDSSNWYLAYGGLRTFANGVQEIADSLD